MRLCRNHQQPEHRRVHRRDHQHERREGSAAQRRKRNRVRRGWRMLHGSSEFDVVRQILAAAHLIF
jgi:hypothetical protein